MSRLATAALAAVLTLAAPASALAAWDAGGDGSAYSKARSLPAGSQPAATVANRSVDVSWPAAGEPAVSGYIVKRYDAGDTAQAVGASCSGTIAATSCTENAVAPGTWRYTVTPASGNWRGAESPPSAAVVVNSPALSLGPSTVATLPATLNGQITDFIAGQTISFRLDDPATGTVLGGSVTPSPVPASGTADASVTLPAGTAPGSHTVYAIGDQGDVASSGVTVLNPQTVTTTAWGLRDASAGGAEADTSDPIAFAAEHRFEFVHPGIDDSRRGLEAIDRDPRTGRVTVCLREIKNSRAIGQMIAPDAVSSGGLLYVLKYGNLLVGKRCIRCRRQRKMAHEPPHHNARKITTSGEKSQHFVRPNTDTPHPGIHLEVHGDALTGPCCRAGQGLDHF